ncbi:MAG: ATP-binding protein [Cyanobacteria bacterium P01_F01_bin.150]
MTLHSHLPLLPTDSADNQSDLSSCALLSSPDVTYIQDGEGCCYSFVWQNSSLPGVNPEQLSYQTAGNRHLVAAQTEGFRPIAIAPYLSRIRHIINTQVPDRIQCPVWIGQHSCLFDLTISPILIPHGRATQVLVVGCYVKPLEESEAIALVDDLAHSIARHQRNRYQEILTDVAWNIRRTLDLETIWSHTVDGLGKALNADRCLICLYQTKDQPLTVVGEYRKHPDEPTMLDHSLYPESQPYLLSGLKASKPLSCSLLSASSSLLQSRAIAGDSGSETLVEFPHPSLAIATSYQDAVNGLILIWQQPTVEPLEPEDFDLIQEFADQVGTGIAHASLFTASQDLAMELRQTNGRLVQKHHELEEAHQRAEEASRLKSEFLANTSHELRTPLNGMIGFLKLVLDGMADDPEEQHEFINEAYRSAVHLLNLINDILDIARIEAGRMQLEMNPVNLNELISEVERFTRTQAEQKSLLYEVFTPVTDDEIILYGNYQRLLQVMLNLVGNAIKFTEEGSITIKAELEDAEDLDDFDTDERSDQKLNDNNIDPTVVGDTDLLGSKPLSQSHSRLGNVKISVADTGIGVSLEDQDKLFQTFSQVEASRTRRFGGSGLGLVISQKLVEEMSGVVNFFSLGEGLGSTVTFTVPLYQNPVLMDSKKNVESQSDSQKS